MTYSRGPWRYDAESGEVLTDDRTGFWGPDHEPVSVCTVTPLDGVNNGPLLAAAQEMLDACQLIELALKLPGITAAEILDDSSPIRIAIQASIAKATGGQA